MGFVGQKMREKNKAMNVTATRASAATPLNFAPLNIDIDEQADGALHMSSRVPVTMREAHLPAYLRRHAQARPQALWISQREGGDGAWRSLSYGEARKAVDSLAQGLLDLKLPQGSSLAILTGNSIEHALIMLAAMQVHIPVSPISTAYSQPGGSHGRLKELLGMVKPGAIFVHNAEALGGALDIDELADVQVIAMEGLRAGRQDIAFAGLAERVPGEAVDQLFATIPSDGPAKYVFTSGSSGGPKAVIQTQRNLVFATESHLATYGLLAEGEMVRLEWTPWSHVMGAAGLGLALVAGGHFYIDEGRPTGAMFGQTLRNLAEVSPTTYASVPAGYLALADALEADADLPRAFFARLGYMIYAGASLPDEVAARIRRLSHQYQGTALPLFSGYGSTETGPGATFVYWPTDRLGIIGLAQPGYALKLVPVGDGRFEVRVRSEGVTPGYLARPELNAEIFDAEGYYRMGDTVRFADPAKPLEGLVFAGRLSDEFKLQTGTFVQSGALRAAVLEATAPLLQEVVICGEDQPFVAALIWLNLEAARGLANQPDAAREELNRNGAVRAAVAKAIAGFNRHNPASSRRIERFCLLDAMPSLDLGEVTDKGTINQRIVQRHRKPLVDALFVKSASADVVEVTLSA